MQDKLIAHLEKIGYRNISHELEQLIRSGMKNCRLDVNEYEDVYTYIIHNF